MDVLTFDALVLGWVLLLAALFLWGRVRSDVDPKQTTTFVGVFLLLLPLVGGNLLDSAGMLGGGVLVRAALFAVSLGGLAVAVRGYRMEDPGTEGALDR
jgi:hypothetical protein